MLTKYFNYQHEIHIISLRPKGPFYDFTKKGFLQWAHSHGIHCSDHAAHHAKYLGYPDRTLKQSLLGSARVPAGGQHIVELGHCLVLSPVAGRHMSGAMGGSGVSIPSHLL